MSEIKNIVVLPNLTREHAFDITVKVVAVLEEKGLNCFLPNYLTNVFPSYHGGYISLDNLSGVDLIIAVGGDGTMINAAKLAYDKEIKVLGVNAGHLAYLMGIDNNETDSLSHLKTGDFKVIDRICLDISIYDEKDNKIGSNVCINDVVFARGQQIKLVSLDLYCDDKHVNKFIADGIVISTPTGSTAYNLSAGGPIVDPRVETILCTPIAPHSLKERTILFSEDSVITVSRDFFDDNEVVWSCDGETSHEFKKGYKALIKKADKKAHFITINEDNFMDVLNKKMIQM